MENSSFPRVVETGEHCQVVLMSIPPGGEIRRGDSRPRRSDAGLRYRFRGGGPGGRADPDRARAPGVRSGGTKHNFVNAGDEDLNLYTVYASPEHAPGTVHETKAEVVAAEH